jgi:predicted ester cyclase
MNPLEILNLEKNLNSKWRQTDDYKEWLKSKNTWSDDASVDFYFEKVQESSTLDEPVVFEAVQEQATEAVCPVTGQKAATCPEQDKAKAKCPFNKDEQSEMSACPVSGQKAATCPEQDKAKAKCPFNKDEQSEVSACPVSGQQSVAKGCPFNKNPPI